MKKKQSETKNPMQPIQVEAAFLSLIRICPMCPRTLPAWIATHSLNSCSVSITHHCRQVRLSNASSALEARYWPHEETVCLMIILKCSYFYEQTRSLMHSLYCLDVLKLSLPLPDPETPPYDDWCDEWWVILYICNFLLLAIVLTDSDWH
jgi:hypothetical protein